ncbi:MAG: hypothetical protein KDE19_23050 [Caldilineaceae bacterium]|nr:hypothetical protein [Caldilineaceae bacterium]
MYNRISGFMRHLNLSSSNPKRWFAGAWHPFIPAVVGFAYTGIESRHYHSELDEICLGAQVVGYG